MALAGENRLHFSAAIEFELVEVEDDPDRGPWKVSTRKYIYHVVSNDLSEVILFHWHPDTIDRPDPHIHLGSSQLTRSAVVSHKTHIPTGRVSLESVFNLLIADFGVVPRRPDWEPVLAESHARFMEYRTWH